MNPDDRINDALKGLAAVEASRDFTAQVRARIDAGDTVPARWPRVSMACAAVVVVAVTAMWLLRVPGVPPAPSVTTARAAPAAVDAVTAPAPRQEPTPLVAIARRPPTRTIRAAQRLRAVPGDIPTDHERALPPLASIDALDTGQIAPAPLVMAEHAIAALSLITPLDVAKDLGGSDR